MPVGSATLAFVVGRPGDLHVAVDALLAQRPRVIAYSLNFRQLGAESVANFFRASIRPAVQRPEQRQSGQSTTLRTDIIERVPGFLRQFDPTFPPDSVGVTNVAYLSRRWKPSGYLRSVIGVTVAADSTDVTELAGDLSALGYDVRHVADTLVAARTGFALKLLPATASRRGVLAVRLATQRRKERECTASEPGASCGSTPTAPRFGHSNAPATCRSLQQTSDLGECGGYAAALLDSLAAELGRLGKTTRFPLVPVSPVGCRCHERHRPKQSSHCTH